MCIFLKMCLLHPKSTYISLFIIKLSSFGSNTCERGVKYAKKTNTKI